MGEAEMKKLPLVDDYVYVSSTKGQNLPIFQSLISVLLKACDRYHVHKVFVDALGRKEFPSTFTAYESGVWFADKVRGRYRFAVLVDQVTELEKHFENVSVNRGGPVRFFTDQAEAKNWLADPYLH